MLGFYYLPCPLCQQDVDESQPEYYRVLSLISEHAKLLSRKDWRWRYATLSINGVKFSRNQNYPSVDYKKRLLLLHQRCYELVKELSYSQLCLLIDVVEPTFLSPSLPPTSRHGDFSCLLSNHSFFNMGPLLDRLPLEIKNMISELGIGRLSFVMKTASQIIVHSKGLETVSLQRFTQEILFVKENMIQIHLIDVGSRIYISRLSADSECSQRDTRRQVYKLDDRSNYLAVKSDGIGILDIAFQEVNGVPQWILGNSSIPFHAETSIIRCASVRKLRIVRDALKCRAIIPSNRLGAEPYFRAELSPPRDSWVDSGFLIQSELAKCHDPFAYFTHATYISFATLKTIDFDIDPGRLGIKKIKVNESANDGAHTIYFSQPPKKMKFIFGGVSIPHCYTHQYPFIQFEIDGQWRPPLPRGCIILREPILVKNVLGIWWGETFPFIPIHIGAVVSDRRDLKNTIL